MARIFISYARKDAGEIADELADQLRAKDHEVFLDVQSIRAGARWRSELSRRIKWSNLIVVLVTEGSNASDYVYQEIREAEQHGKTIVPVKIGDAPLPVHLRGTWQAITLENDNLDGILLEIQSALLHSSGSRTISPMIVVGTVVGIVIVGILAFMLLQNGQGSDDNENTRGGTATNVGIGITETVILEDTPIATDTPTNTSEPPTATATNTDIPTPVDTPTITLTRTPIPTNTPRPPTSTPTLSPTPTDIPEEAILYWEDFEDNMVDGGWRVSGQSPYTLIDDGTGNHVWRKGQGPGDIALSSSQLVGNYILELDYYVVNINYDETIHLNFRAQDETCKHYILVIRSSWMEVSRYDTLSQMCTNVYTNLGGGHIALRTDEWHHIYLEVNGAAIRWRLDNGPLYESFDDTYSTGGISIGAESEIWVDNIHIWSLDADD